MQRGERNTTPLGTNVWHTKKKTRGPPIGEEAKRHGARIRPKAVLGGIFDCFFRCSFRPEVVSDVISGAVVDSTDVKVRVKFGIAPMIIGQNPASGVLPKKSSKTVKPASQSYKT